MATLYDAEYRCKTCKRRFSTILEMKRHYTEVHSCGGKLFKCSRCDYSSDKKSDVDRHTARKHSKSSSQRPSSSKSDTSPPRPQRLDNGWPSLTDIVGSPRSADDFSERKSPPTPSASPTPERPTSSLANNSTSGELLDNSLTAKRRDSTTDTPTEVISSVREEASSGRGLEDQSGNSGPLQRRLSTVVFPDGRVFVTMENFGKKDGDE